MRLVSYDSSGAWRAGVLLDNSVFDLGTLLGTGTVREFLDRHGERLVEAGAALEKAPEDARVGEIGQLRLGPPIPDPSKILCVGLNYRDHVTETGRELPTHPDIFAKFATGLIGPDDEIRCSDVSTQLDYEGELAVVIGRACRNVSAEEALDAVAGLMVLNDITARDLQYNGTQFLPGKAVDGSTPCGPALVTLDEIGDPHALRLTTKVNGKEVQNSNTKHLIFRIPQIFAYVSRFLRLSPGDVISTGTPDGVGSKRRPPTWLSPGDQVEVEVEGVGLIRNTVR